MFSLSTELFKVIWPPKRDLSADVSSVSLSPERMCMGLWVYIQRQ